MDHRQHRLWGKCHKCPIDENFAQCPMVFKAMHVPQFFVTQQTMSHAPCHVQCPIQAVPFIPILSVLILWSQQVWEENIGAIGVGDLLQLRFPYALEARQIDKQIRQEERLANLYHRTKLATFDVANPVHYFWTALFLQIGDNWITHLDDLQGLKKWADDEAFQREVMRAKQEHKMRQVDCSFALELL